MYSKYFFCSPCTHMSMMSCTKYATNRYHMWVGVCAGHYPHMENNTVTTAIVHSSLAILPINTVGCMYILKCA